MEIYRMIQKALQMQRDRAMCHKYAKRLAIGE